MQSSYQSCNTNLIFKLFVGLTYMRVVLRLPQNLQQGNICNDVNLDVLVINQGRVGWTLLFLRGNISGETEALLCWFCCTNKFRTVDPELADSLDPLVHHQHMTILSLFYSYYFGRCSYELGELLTFPYSCGKSSQYHDK